ncbi:MAG: hypothetical protein M3P46_00480 [Actinomycetota bacterium]|nr:hypothetical protein [Actinomycetota bacterium]
MSTTALRRAALLVAVEGVALTLVAVAYALSPVLAQPEDRLGTVLEGLLALLAGAGVLAVARGLAAPRVWAFSPAIVTQLFLVVVAWGLLQGRVYVLALPLLVLAAGVLYLLSRRESRDAYRDLHQQR